jgi:F-type H+-transporting ATPase subunit b
MEILSKLGIDLKILIGQIVNFFLLLIILRLFLYKPILGILKKRQKKIEEGIKGAEEIEKEKKNLEKKSEEILAASRKEAQDILEKAKIAGRQLEKQLKETAQAQSKELISQAEKEISRAKARLIEDAREELAKLVIEANKKIMGRVEKEPTKEEIEEILSKL